jgi:hypothetical protein
VEVALSVLTPLHVWSGAVLDGMHDLVRVPGGYGVVDMKRVARAVGGELVSERAARGVAPWVVVREAGVRAGAVCRYVLADRIGKAGVPRQVRTVVKDAFCRPYLPGSTLRGLLRTAAIVQALRSKGRLRARAERVALEAPHRFTEWLLAETGSMVRARFSDSTPFSSGPALYFAGVYRLGRGGPVPLRTQGGQAGRVVEAVPRGAQAWLAVEGEDLETVLGLLGELGKWQAEVLAACGLPGPSGGGEGIVVAAGGGGGLRLKPVVYLLGDRAAAEVIRRTGFGDTVHAGCGGVAAFGGRGWRCRLCGASGLALGREVFWGKTVTLLADPPVVPGWIALGSEGGAGPWGG